MPTFRSLFPRPVFPWEQRGDVPGKNRAVQADPFFVFRSFFVRFSFFGFRFSFFRFSRFSVFPVFPFSPVFPSAAL